MFFAMRLSIMTQSSSRYQAGIALTEMMIAMAIAMFVMVVAIGVYSQEANIYTTSNSQSSIQSAENAVNAIMAPAIRSAGFLGCTSLSNGNSFNSQLQLGGPPPMGKLGKNGAITAATTAAALSPAAAWAPVSASIQGYDAVPATNPLTITPNAANDASVIDWGPALDATLVTGGGPKDPNGNPVGPEKGSDVVVVLGPVPGSQPVAVTTLNSGGGLVLAAGLSASTLATFPSGQWVALSDCKQATILQVTGTAPNLNFAPGASILTNVGTINDPVTGLVNNNNLFYTLPTPTIPDFAQTIPMQQTAFFVAQDNNGQSSLWMAVLKLTAGTPVWTATPLVPGVDNMQIQYGLSAPGGTVVQQYLRADQVEALGPPSWSLVHSVRIGLLFSGQIGSIPLPTGTQTFNVLDKSITLPADTRLRHVFEMTINLRNAS